MVSIVNTTECKFFKLLSKFTYCNRLTNLKKKKQWTRVNNCFNTVTQIRGQNYTSPTLYIATILFGQSWQETVQLGLSWTCSSRQA